MTPARLEELRQMAGAVDGPKSAWMDELIEEVDRLRGPFTCGHPPEFAGGACAVCQAELLEKIEAANLQIDEARKAFQLITEISPDMEYYQWPASPFQSAVDVAHATIEKLALKRKEGS